MNVQLPTFQDWVSLRDDPRKSTGQKHSRRAQVDLGWYWLNIVQSHVLINTSQKNQKDESGRGTKINSTCRSMISTLIFFQKYVTHVFKTRFRRFWKCQAFFLSTGVIL